MAGWDDVSSHSEPSSQPPATTTHTVRELEAHLNERLFERCKIDACFDRFVAQLDRLHPLCYDEPQVWSQRPVPLRDGFVHYIRPDATETVKQGFEEALRQLNKDLSRLAPKYLHRKSTDGGLALEAILPRCQQRAKNWAKEHDEVSSADSFRLSLLHTLAELNYQKLVARIQPGEKHGAPPLQESAFWQSCRQLKQVIVSEQLTASFTCGGTITIAATSPGEDVDEALVGQTSAPIGIYWAIGNDSHARRVVLPLSGAGDSNEHVLQELVRACIPATFGKGEQDVLDLAYRNAGKMDTEAFATTFDPAQFGILENVEQILLPSIGNDGESKLQLRKLSAKLYKLNVYSGPSGLFRKHVDTPRSTKQIGSLVVCLPSRFEGGNLLVRHHGQKVDFDWSSKSDSTIQWAAFYSDCEHEINTISKGDRITLTYNLFITEPIGGSLLPNAIVDAKTLPLYRHVKQLLEQPGFMKHGGVLGFFCSHAYAHSSRSAIKGLPRRLKGSDLVLYSVFKELSIETRVLPVIERNGRYIEKNPRLESDHNDSRADGDAITGYRSEGEEDYESLPGSFDRQRYNQVPIATVLDEYLGGDVPKYGLAVQEYPTKGFHYNDDVDSRWKVLVLKRRITGLATFVDRAASEGLDVTGLSYRSQGARVGSSLHAYKAHNQGGEEDADRIARDLWPFLRLPGITWLTEPKHQEMAFSFLAHGNEASVDTRYSCAAILAVIPTYAERAGGDADTGKSE